MKDISKVVTEDLFISSYQILNDFVIEKADSLQDINLILISDYLTGLTVHQVKKFYNKYISNGLVYSLPEFFASDLVTIPKGVSDVREYRFFSAFGMILYNALGIFFAEMCAEMVTNLNLQDRGIYSYAPTKYTNQNAKWRINNKWQQEYDKYKNKLKETAEQSDLVLSIDISNFFKSIKHKKLTETINDFTSAQNREKYSFDGNSEDILNHYFLSMMGENKGLPQGKKNFASDYLAYLYLVNFDMELESLVGSDLFEFVASVRYVDDVHIFFKKKKELSNSSTYKELSKIEHGISKWLYKKLGLYLNDKKTSRKIIIEKTQKDEFINSAKKKTSGSAPSPIVKEDLDEKIKLFADAVAGFAYPNTLDFTDGLIGGKDRENLKYIFDLSVKNKLAQKSEVKKMTKVLSLVDLELSATQFNIFGALFEIGSQGKKPYRSVLISYFKKNFDPRDKRHIHIMLIASAVMLNPNLFRSIVDEYKKELIKDDYGKYLVAYYFPKSKKQLASDNYWTISNRVYERICAERDNKFKNFPFLGVGCSHPFKSIIFLDKTRNLDSTYTALCGYVHEFRFRRWSVAFNKLQMITHESIKYSFREVKDTDSGKEIIKKLIKNGLIISTYEERDFLNFWERRNFNPISHGSKNGLTSPEVTYKELTEWERKVSVLVDKIYLLKN